MDIHEYSDNLDNSRETESPEEKNNHIEEFETAKIEETNNNAVNDEGIHASETNTMTSEEFKKKKAALIIAKHYKLMQNRQQVLNKRNDIMRSVYNERHIKSKNSKVKQMISAGRKVSNNTSNHFVNRIDVLNNLSKFVPKKKDNLLTSHSYGGFIREKPPITEEEIKFGTFNNSSMIGSEHQHSFNRHNNSIFITNAEEYSIGNTFYNSKNNVIITEKPKEINLAEIMTSVLKDVVSGEIKTIDCAIAKLRVDFEGKNLFTNANKKNIILLNFEDDTIKPVIEIEEKYMKIINKWYESCNLILDIEKTNSSIPETITVQDVSGVLFNEINYKYKDEYLYKYLPLIINNIISNRSIRDLERKYFSKLPNKTPSSNNFVNQTNETNIIYENLGIKIPQNLLNNNESDDKKNNDKYFTFQSGSIYNNFGGTIGGIIRTIDPEILPKKEYNQVNSNQYSYGMVVPDNIEKIELEPYNKIYEDTKLIQDDKDPKKIVFSYNHDFNVLNPKFGDASYITDDLYSNEKVKPNTSTESIYIIYNSKFLQSLCIVNPSSDILYILQKHTEFGFIKLFSLVTSNTDIVQFVKNEFDKFQFNDIDELNQKLNVTSQYIEFLNKHNNLSINISSEELQVKKYIESTFLIDNDINNKMKASILHDVIINSKIVKIDESKISGFKNRLSKYLKDLGLEKKRYNDGYYYYGIRNKLSNSISNKPNIIDYNKLIQEREDPIALLKEVEEKRAEKKRKEGSEVKLI